MRLDSEYFYVTVIILRYVFFTKNVCIILRVGVIILKIFLSRETLDDYDFDI